jgi:hypothetical protein
MSPPVDPRGGAGNLMLILETAMRRRVFAAAFAASLVLPQSTFAQFSPAADLPAWGAGYRVTPFVGYLTSITRAEEWIHRGGGEPRYMNSRVVVAGGNAAGLSVEAPVRGHFGVGAAGGYASRGNSTFTVLQTGEAYVIDGHDVFFGRLAGTFHMPAETSDFIMRRLGAHAFAGGVVMHERPRTNLVTRDALSNATHLGINLGVAAELPFAADRFALQVGVEDNILWWNRTALAALPHEYFQQPPTTRAQTTVTTDPSHAWLLRAGLVFRMR